MQLRISDHELAIRLPFSLRDFTQSWLLAHNKYVSSARHRTCYFSAERLNHALNFVFAQVQSAATTNFWKPKFSEVKWGKLK